jgi:hypothetical protein
MLETATVVVIVLAAAYFFLRAVFRQVKGKKTHCGSVPDKCGSCDLAAARFSFNKLEDKTEA